MSRRDEGGIEEGVEEGGGCEAWEAEEAAAAPDLLESDFTRELLSALIQLEVYIAFNSSFSS